MSANHITDPETGQQRESDKLPQELAGPVFRPIAFRQEVPALLPRCKVVRISFQAAAKFAAVQPARRETTPATTNHLQRDCSGPTCSAESAPVALLRQESRHREHFRPLEPFINPRVTFMRMGILGGTFDPIHYGHLLAAEACREALALNQVRFMPAAASPHKPDQRAADGHARADMIQLAIAGCPEFVVDRRELRRPAPSWTIDTLRSLRSEFPEAELFLLLGADSLREFLTWKDPLEISQLATLAVCNRPGSPAPTPAQTAAWVGPEIATRVVPVSIPGIDLSATDLRQRSRQGQSLRFRTPRAVEAFLTEHKLYRN
jgi:nicotinate-nucleotide adenylyltransferase